MQRHTKIWWVAAIVGAFTFSAFAAQEAPAPTLIDYSGFQKLTNEVGPYRASRLISLETFDEMASDPETIILDTRSAEAFQMGHLKGAINLPFSDFTDEKLELVLGKKDRRILIYCNNNFLDDVAPVVLKSAPLALNVPTFINLYGYGYKNIYELGDTLKTDDPRIEFIWGGSAG